MMERKVDRTLHAVYDVPKIDSTCNQYPFFNFSSNSYYDIYIVSFGN